MAFKHESLLNHLLPFVFKKNERTILNDSVTSKKNMMKISSLLTMAYSQTDDKADSLMFKNRLQEYAQKSGLPLPVYQNVNEGFPHAPKFRPTVLVDKTKYTSQNTFPDRRAAEQEVAKLAYESITKRTKTEDRPSIYQEPMPIFCKSILHEYAIKRNLGIPKYHTTNAEGTRPVFTSSFVLGGETYTGEVAQSKKVAEQLVARAAIHSLLGSDSGTLAQIIQSKDKLYASLHAKKYSGYEGISTPAVWPESLSRQQASIKTEIIRDNAGLGSVTDPRIGAKRKFEINYWEQKKKSSHEA